MNCRQANGTIAADCALAAAVKLLLLLGPVMAGQAVHPEPLPVNEFDPRDNRRGSMLASQGLFHQSKHLKRDPHHTLPGCQGKRSSR